MLRKIAALAVLAVCSVSITSVIVRPKRSTAWGAEPIKITAAAVNPKGPAAPKAEGVTISAKTTPARAREVKKFVPGPNLLSHARMRKVQAEAQGTLVHITAQGYVFDKRPGVQYAWAVRVRDSATDGVVSERLYDRQIFHVGPALEASPAFDDVIELNPGSYRVQVVVYEFNDIRQLKNPVGLVLMGGSARVTTTAD